MIPRNDRMYSCTNNEVVIIALHFTALLSFSVHSEKPAFLEVSKSYLSMPSRMTNTVFLLLS